MHRTCRDYNCFASILALTTALFTTPATADWPNAGGNSQRNGRTPFAGPAEAQQLWAGGRPSIIAWQPVIHGNRAFMVRQNAFIPNNVPNDAPVVCMDLHTGEELWVKNIPYNSGDWTTWIAGARDGRVYASRSGNGASVNAKLHCLDASDGHTIWLSDELINAGAYDGVVFAPNGDLIIASMSYIKRIRAIDGSTAWTIGRICSVSGNCGGAVHGDGIYIADAAVGGHVIKKYDLVSGAFLYASPVMIGFTLQQSPFVGPDGTIYLARTQNNVNTDFFYAFTDTGTSLVQAWSVPPPARWCTSSEFTVGNDGSIYMFAPGNVVRRLDPKTGEVINSSLPLALDSPGGNVSIRMACDSQGRLFISNGQFPNGRIYSFNADLSERWNVAVPNINIGAPAIGADGILIVCGIGTNVRAFDTKPKLGPCPADIAPENKSGPPHGDGQVNVDDLLALLGDWGPCPGCLADLNADDEVNVDDLLTMLAAWGGCSS